MSGVDARSEALSADEARLSMVHELHVALYGSSWARPESPKEVWDMLLNEVRFMRLRSDWSNRESR